MPDEKTVTLEAAELPDGGFGFEYCCGRSFVVDNVLVERSLGDVPQADESKNLIAGIAVASKGAWPPP